MEPSTKRRKLAPKLAPSADPNPQPVHHPHDVPVHYPVPEPLPPPPTERHDFESFARHLQDAAMLIQRQAERPQYSDVSVLILKWEGDDSPNPDTSALEKLLRTTYHFRTQQWQIPSCPNPSIKLGVQIASFLETPKPDHLLIIYYAGHGFVGSDGQLYWASNGRDDSAKLKWDGVRCLFEDAQSDMLLLLDTCAIPDPVPSGNNGLKQVIAASTPEYNSRENPARSFTSSIVEVLQRLSTSSRPFSTQQLFEDIHSLQLQQVKLATSSTTNGLSSTSGLPITFTITPNKGQTITLAPLVRKVSESAPATNGTAIENQAASSREEGPISPDDVTDIKFDEARILVCTTFVGDASPDMSFFHQWLQSTPSMGANIAVEGMFLGPPTMLLISMPHSVWNVVQHDKVCCFLGYITSHNMLHLYQRLVGPTGPKPGTKHAEDGRTPLEARDTTAGPHSHLVRERDPRDPPRLNTTSREGPSPTERPNYVLDSTPTRAPYVPISPGSAPVKRKEEHEGSAEMREAAEQLKALSHVRHRSDEGPHASGRPRTSLPNGILHTDGAPGPDGPLSPGKQRSPNRVKVPRHALPKNDTRCSHCSHAPFRDSSSLRKHIAAAHTRPFPCAFSFAGCNSTFGSKNEWKRHITSQHLCLQFYRCSECPQSAAEGKANEFNRKDLFTQHLRRMHAPFQVKRPVSTRDSRIQAEWELQVKSLQETCLVTRRHPPQKSACPKPDCQSGFEGAAAWDEWTEHVGRHMEKGEAANLGVDQYLIDWALKEGVIERKSPDGQFSLCHNSSGNTNGGSEGNSAVETKDPTPPTPAEPSQPETSPVKEPLHDPVKDAKNETSIDVKMDIDG